MLLARLTAEECQTEGSDGAIGYSYDSDALAAVENPAAENGEIETSADGLSWLNSARVHAEPDRDRVSVTISIGDPRGCFVMSAERLPDGRILLSVPHPGESLAHMPTAELHPGTLLVTHEAGNVDKPVIFSMADPAGDVEDDE